MAIVFQVVTVDDEDGSELGTRYFDEAGNEVPAPALARAGRVPAQLCNEGVSATRGAVAQNTSKRGTGVKGGGRSRAVRGVAGGVLAADSPDGRARRPVMMAPPPLCEENWAALLGCEAVFLPGDPSRSGRMVFHAAGVTRFPAGLPAGAAEDVEVVVAHGRATRRRTVPAVVRPLAEALPRLLAAQDADGTFPSRNSSSRAGPLRSDTAEAWRHAALYALHMAGRGLLLPGVSAAGHDAWRLGPFTQEDAAWVRALAEALPAAAYGVPLEPAGAGRGPVLLPEPYARLRAFLDAVADLLPRTAAAAAATGVRPFAASEPQRVPQLRAWAVQIADGRDAGVRVSLRLELPGRAESGPGTAGEQIYEYEGESHGGPVGGGYDRFRGDDPYRDPHTRYGGTQGLPVVRAVVQLHSLADPLLLADAADVWSGTAQGFGARTRDRVNDQLRRAAQAWRPLARLLQQPVPDVLPLDDDEFLDLLDGGALALADAGVTVHLPRDLARDLTASAVVEPDGPSERDADAEVPSFFSSEQLLNFRWEFAVGDRTLTQVELDRLAHARRPLVRLRDQWVVVDAGMVRKAQRAGWELGALDALTAALTGTVEDCDGVLVPVRAVGWLAALRDRLAAPEQADPSELAAPQALDATLRGYQLRGLAWLDRMTRLGLGACLADDMGLGKTITTLALHLRRQEGAVTGAGPTLVVCPASLLGNWGREIDKFAPGTPWRRHHGPDRDLGGLKRNEIVLTTYATMRRDAQRLADAGPWGLLVADEAQHVKNPAGATAKALRTLPGASRVALSGTPVENNLSELWALLDWTTPGLLGPLKTFRERYGRAAERAARAVPANTDSTTAPGGHDTAAAERLSRLIGPFVLRRRKCDPGIAPELPPKTETDQRVLLTREQTVLYEAQVRESLAAIREAKGIARHGLVLKLLTALKQICNHPAQYLKEPDGTRLTGRSGKLELLDELLEVILCEDESVLLFTQYTQMARHLERHLSECGVKTLFLHGRTPVRRREEMVDAFQRGEAPVFLLSLKAAGTGLNLTRAGHVIHYDRWWNPAVEDQATDRAYRIGQTRPVQVHRMISEGTVEDRIDKLLASKRHLADSVLGGGEAALTDLTDAELADLVSLHAASGAMSASVGRSRR